MSTTITIDFPADSQTYVAGSIVSVTGSLTWSSPDAPARIYTQVFEFDSSTSVVGPSLGSWTEYVDGTSSYQYDWSWVTPLLASGVTAQYQISVEVLGASGGTVLSNTTKNIRVQTT